MSTHDQDGTPAEPRPLTQVPPPATIRPGVEPASTESLVPPAAPVRKAPGRPSRPAQPGTSRPGDDRTRPRPLTQAPTPPGVRRSAQPAGPGATPSDRPGPDRTRVQPAPVDRTEIQVHRTDLTVDFGDGRQAQYQGTDGTDGQQDQTRSFLPQTFPLSSADPQILGSYRLLGRLLSPDVATDHSRPVVFLGQDGDGVHVVVKAARLDSGWEPLERLRREARNAVRVGGTQVAGIVQAPAEDLGYLYIVQQYVQGVPLDRMLQQRPDGRLAPEDTYRLALGLLSALTAIHAAGVTHRDVKPGNIIVTADGPVMVDFGNSHHEDDDRITTSGGQRWGTPKYMSPEQFDDLGVSHSIDLFGWAVTIVESASAHHPFADASQPVAYQHVNGRVAPNISGVPVELIPVIRTALEPDGRRRSSASYLERRMARTDTVHQLDSRGDVPLPGTGKPPRELPHLPSTFSDLRARWQDALVDGNRWFVIACVVAVFLSVPAGIVLHILAGLVF